MSIRLFNWLDLAWQVFQNNLPWMAWNSFLALVPLALSFWLFKRHSQARSPSGRYEAQSLFWWIGVLVFIAFLPNAPYVLTDIIHLISDIRQNHSVWLVTLILIPQYFLFFLLGFEAYVLSLINLGHYLNQQGWRRFILPTELFLHVLSAIGIYLGRFKRFNSWDIVTNLDVLTNSVLDDLVGKWPLLTIAITFIILVGLYWFAKQITLGLMTRQRLKAQCDRTMSENF